MRRRSAARLRRAALAVAVVAGLALGARAASAQDLLISGVVDGPLPGGLPKAIEVYVVVDVADLSVYGLGSANNGGGSDGEEFTFPAVPASKGEFIYVASETTGFTSFFGFAPSYTSAAASINGDDAIELFEDGSVVDVFGDIDTNGNGEPWEYLDGWGYRQSGTGPDGSTFVLGSWSFSGPNALDGETTNAGAATPFPIGSYGGGGDRPPGVSGVVPSDGAVVAPDTDIEITFSEPVSLALDWFTLECTSSGPIAAMVTGDDGDTVFTLVPSGIDGGDSCTLTVLASGVTDLDDPRQSMAADATFTFATLAECGDPGTTPISAIQGDGPVSPLVGSTVSIEAVTTGDFQDGGGEDGDLNGFYLQDAIGDGDTATSDGVFVFDGSSPDVDVTRGDVVRVTGVVEEFFGETQLEASSVQICASGTHIAPTPVKLPAAASIENTDGELIADLEHVEGMLVVLPQTLAVTELFNLDRFGELRLAVGGRLFQFTNASGPDVAGFAAHLDEIARRNVLLDDGLTIQSPEPIRYPAPGLDTANPVRMGDTVTGLVGNVRFSRGSGGSGDEVYRIMPVGAEPVFQIGNERPDGLGVPGRLRVASFNVLNFFNDLDDGTGECFPSFTDDDCRGADSKDEFDRQLEKLVSALAALDADIVGLIELENDYPDDDRSSIATLVDALNASRANTCSGDYAFVDPQRRVGDDAIAVGLIYCTATVGLTPGTTVEVLTDDDLPDLGIDPGEGVFDGEAANRAPLAATFTELDTGQVVTVVANHFKSKGPSGLGDAGSVCEPDPPADPNCDQGDGQGFWNARRTQAAAAVAGWLATDPTGSGDPDQLIVGDLNAYLREDPVEALTGAAYVNLLETLGAGGDAYSFVFDGQAGALDHALASPSLEAQVSGIVEWHVNADEADGIDYNLDFGRNPGLFDGSVPFRASDHDPVVVGLDLRSIAETCTQLVPLPSGFEATVTQPSAPTGPSCPKSAPRFHAASQEVEYAVDR